MDETTRELAELLSVVLGVPVSPGGSLAMQSCKAWDSMKHIELIMTIEEKFGISFAPQDIPLLISQPLLEARTVELLRESSG